MVIQKLNFSKGLRALSVLLLSSTCAQALPSYEEGAVKGAVTTKIIGGALQKITNHRQIIDADASKAKGRGVKVYVFDKAFDPYSDISKENMSKSFLASIPHEGSPEALERRFLAQSKGRNHSNHVASIIAGKDGISPHAKIHVVDFDNDPELKNIKSHTNQLITALNRVIKSRERELELFSKNTDPNAEFFSHYFINISMRMSPDYDSNGKIDKDLIETLLRARDLGIGIAKSGGNDSEMTGDTPYTRSLAKVLRKMNNFMRIAVSTNYHDDAGEVLSGFSNKAGIAEQFALAAPGEGILATGADNVQIVMSGTSMASPIVVGSAANVASDNPHLNAAQVFDLMDHTARKMSANGKPLETEIYGAGVIQGDAAAREGKQRRNMFVSVNSSFVSSNDDLPEIPFIEPTLKKGPKEEPKIQKVGASSFKNQKKVVPQGSKTTASKIVGFAKNIATVGTQVVSTVCSVMVSAVKTIGSWFGY